MTALSAAQQAQQMDAAPSSIVAAAGVQPCFLRAPGGSFNPTTLALARERGMTLTGWANDAIDWTLHCRFHPLIKPALSTARSIPFTTTRLCCCTTALP
jgi:peptidoglycan/xylan/chitin deacetylase (PgdA/CDA1 family)